MSARAVAIDGPSGAGKSTIARAVSKRLGYIYVDTGALYRAIGAYALEMGADTKSAEQVIPLLPQIEVKLTFIDGEQHVLLNGKDVSKRIRENEVSMAASNVSAIPKVREFLFQLQRDIAASSDCIMDGRDIGTVVLPNADVKIFLTATPEKRALRRQKELIEKGEKVDFNELLEQIKQRDYNDSHRATAPLKQADDAVLLDTTDMSLDEAISKAESIITGKAK